MLFGEFLIQKGAVGATAILEALDDQQRRKPFLGRVAVRARALTVVQVLRVLNRQVDDRRSFGVHAVELGYIDEATLDRILVDQRTAVPPLGEILVESGSLEPSRLQEMLRLFEAR